MLHKLFPGNQESGFCVKIPRLRKQIQFDWPLSIQLSTRLKKARKRSSSSPDVLIHNWVCRQSCFDNFLNRRGLSIILLFAVVLKLWWLYLTTTDCLTNLFPTYQMAQIDNTFNYLALTITHYEQKEHKNHTVLVLLRHLDQRDFLNKIKQIE